MGNYTNYTDNAIDYEMPDYVVRKRDGETFCTVEGYSRLTNLTHEQIYKRLRAYYFSGSGVFDVCYDDIDEIIIISLPVITDWILKDSPLTAERIMGSQSVVCDKRLRKLLQYKKNLDTKAELTSIQQSILPKYINNLNVMLEWIEDLAKVTAVADENTKEYEEYTSVISQLGNQDDLYNDYIQFFLWLSAELSIFKEKVETAKRIRESQLARIGTVYLVGSDKARILKIGYTKKSIEERLKELQAGRSYELRVFKTKPGTRETEAAELLKARRFSIHSEWFTWDDSIIENF